MRYFPTFAAFCPIMTASCIWRNSFQRQPGMGLECGVALSLCADVLHRVEMGYERQHHDVLGLGSLDRCGKGFHRLLQPLDNRFALIGNALASTYSRWAALISFIAGVDFFVRLDVR